MDRSIDRDKDRGNETHRERGREVSRYRDTAIHVHTYTCTHAHMHTCTYAYAHIHTSTHAHIHTCTHPQIHRYTEKHTEMQTNTDAHITHIHRWTLTQGCMKSNCTKKLRQLQKALGAMMRCGLGSRTEAHMIRLTQLGLSLGSGSCLSSGSRGMPWLGPIKTCTIKLRLRPISGLGVGSGVGR